MGLNPKSPESDKGTPDRLSFPEPPLYVRPNRTRWELSMSLSNRNAWISLFTRSKLSKKKKKNLKRLRVGGHSGYAKCQAHLFAAVASYNASRNGL